MRDEQEQFCIRHFLNSYILSYKAVLSAIRGEREINMELHDLQWQWDKCIGTWSVYYDSDIGWRTYKLYRGNAFKIMIYEYKEDGIEKYDVYDFWADRNGMKNCLGETEDYDFIYHEWKRNKIVLYRNMIDRKWLKDFTDSVLNAFDDISLRIIPGGETDEQDDEN